MFSFYQVLPMRGDRQPVSPTELAQLSRCEQQLLFDARYGRKRSAHWQKRAAEGDVVHARLHRQVTADKSGARVPLWMWLAAGLLAAALLAFWLLGQGR